MIKKNIFLISFVFIILNSIICAQNSPSNIDRIKDYIKYNYMQAYPTLEISNISLLVRDKLDIKNIQISRMNLASTKNHEGYIKIEYFNGQNMEMIKYIIEGKIEVYTATTSIKAKSNITKNDIKLSQLNFISFNFLPATIQSILDSSAKSYIAANSIIYKDKLEKKILVFKDSII